MSKEEFYKYGESLGIKINDLQRLKILANADNEEYIFEVAMQFHRLGKYYGNTSDTHFTDIYEETIKAINKQD